MATLIFVGDKKTVEINVSGDGGYLCPGIGKTLETPLIPSKVFSSIKLCIFQVIIFC